MSKWLSKFESGWKKIPFLGKCFIFVATVYLFETTITLFSKVNSLGAAIILGNTVFLIGISGIVLATRHKTDTPTQPSGPQQKAPPEPVDEPSIKDAKKPLKNCSVIVATSEYDSKTYVIPEFNQDFSKNAIQRAGMYHQLHTAADVMRDKGYNIKILKPNKSGMSYTSNVVHLNSETSMGREIKFPVQFINLN